MKKYLIFTIFVLDMIMLSSAQSEAFFSYKHDYRENEEWGELVLLPDAHGLDYNYPADNVYVGTGLFLMLGMGMAYTTFKKRNDD